MKRIKGVWVSFLPVPILLVAISIVYATVDPAVYYDPEWLILLCNTLLITVVSLIVAFIAMRDYMATGRLQVLLLGCGVLTFGLGAVSAASVRNLHDGANINVTIYNTAALFGALFHFAAAFLLTAGTSYETDARRRRLWVALGYGGSTVLIAALVCASLWGMTPVFKVQGALGFTRVGQIVLGGAVALFSFSFVMFLGTYLRNREVFLSWYSMALALTSISLTAFFIQSSVGSPVGWIGRFSQYLGGLYFLIALFAAGRSAQVRRTSLDIVLTASLTGAEEKYRALSENSPDIIRRFDRKLHHLYVNPAGLRLYGRPPIAVLGKDVDEVGLSVDQAAGLRESILQVFRTGESSEVDEEVLTGSDPRFLQSRFVPEFGSDGTVANVLVVSRDLTVRLLAEKALRVSERRWATTLASIGDAVIATDPEGTITFMNRVAEDLTGWKLTEAMRKPITEVFRIMHQMTGTEVENPVTKILETGAIVGLADHVVLVRKDDSMVPIDDSGAPIKDEAGRTMGVVLIFRDITGRKSAEEALRKARDELEKRVRERTAELERRTAQLRVLAMELTQAENRERKRVAAVLHDHLQQLLVAAKLGMQCMERKPLGYDLAEPVRQVTGLLDDSIKISRSLTVELSPPILHDAGLVPAVKWLSRWMEEKHGLVVRVSAEEQAVPDTEETSLLLYQSVRELLFNVIKHAGVKEARVSVMESGSELRTVVEDDGAGFDVGETEESGSEAGFGLFSIRERIDILGGRMEITSAAGKGTRVSLSTPLRTCRISVGGNETGVTGPLLPAPTSAAGGRTGNLIRVLVADDHTLVREGLVKLIQGEDDMVVVAEASDGVEAVELARKLRPHVIIMDMNMPRMSGTEAMSRIAEEMKEIRVICLSMYEKGDYEAAMRKGGAAAYLSKDGPSEDLISAIRGV